MSEVKDVADSIINAGKGVFDTIASLTAQYGPDLVHVYGKTLQLLAVSNFAISLILTAMCGSIMIIYALKYIKHTSEGYAATAFISGSLLTVSVIYSLCNGWLNAHIWASMMDPNLAIVINIIEMTKK